MREIRFRGKTAEPELIPISWCNGCPDRIVFRPLAMIREGCFKHCLWDYARVPYVVCRYDTPSRTIDGGYHCTKVSEEVIAKAREGKE